MSKKSLKDRREFLIGMIVGATGCSSSGRKILETIIDQFISNAHAQSSDTFTPNDDSSTFICFSKIGGVSEQMLGCFRPRSTDPYIPNISLSNQFIPDNGDNIEFRYTTKTYSIGGEPIDLPRFWDLPIYNSKNESTPMNVLFKNRFSYRGVSKFIDNHPICEANNDKPNPTGPSLTGLLADESKRPIPAVMDPLLSCYKSLKGTPLKQDTPDRESANNLLDVFLKGHSNAFRTIARVDEAINDFIASMKNSIESKDAKLGMGDTFVKSEELFKKNINTFITQYQQTYDKYAGLVARTSSSADNIKGFVNPTSKKVTKFLNFPIRVQGEYWDVDNWPPELGAYKLYGVGNTTDFYGGTEDELYEAVLTVPDLYHHLIGPFANAEFLTSTKLTSSMHYRTSPSITKITLKAIPASQITITKGNGYTTFDYNGTPAEKNFIYSADCHQHGPLYNMAVTGIFYQVYHSLMWELIESLKQENIFDKVVIHDCSDFARSPRNDGTGGDHGWQSAHGSIYSGLIKEEGLLIGNLYDKRSSTMITYEQSKTGQTGKVDPYWGTWHGAPVQGAGIDGGTEQLNIGHIASTIAQLLSLPSSPSANSKPLLKKQGNQYIIDPSLEKAKNLRKA